MRLLRIIVNWFLVLSMPIWGGFALLAHSISEIGRDQFVADAMKGKDWIWKT